MLGISQKQVHCFVQLVSVTIEDVGGTHFMRAQQTLNDFGAILLLKLAKNLLLTELVTVAIAIFVNWRVSVMGTPSSAIAIQKYIEHLCSAAGDNVFRSEE